MKIPSGKTKVEIMQDVHQSELKKGDIGYIDGYVQAGDTRPYASVVRITDGYIDLATVWQLKAIIPERIKTQRSSNLNPTKVIELWNKFAHENKLPQKRAATEGLKKSINDRTEQQKWTIEDWGLFFVALSNSDFLMGKATNFKLSLDWLAKPTNFSKAISGNYHE